MAEIDIARQGAQLADFGSLLRARWQKGVFHAVAAITVPELPLDLAALPLSDEEHARIRSLFRVMDRNRSAIGRVVLRTVASAMLNSHPKRVTVKQEQGGKPFVPSGPGISISHSGNLVVVAFSSDARIGIDIEPDRDDADLSAAILPALSPMERSAVPDDPSLATAWLLRSWVRKEAVVKLLGTGLSSDLTQIAVAEQEGGRFRCRLPGVAVVDGIDLQMATGYVGALASMTHIEDVVYYQGMSV